MNFNHILITRFNLQLENNSDQGIDKEWLEHRCQLFETYCLPSVQAQTCQDFTWLLLLDKRTPLNYQHRITHYSELYSNIRCVWLGFYEDVNKCYLQLGSQYKQNGMALLSSRLDNDDSLFPSYIERVQQFASSKSEDGFISLPYGEQVFLQTNYQYSVYCTTNHFLSLLEKDSYKTVLGTDHTKIAKQQLQIVSNQECAWKEYVHGRNICNDYCPDYKYKVTSIRDLWRLWTMWIRFQIKRIASHFPFS